MGRQGAIPRPTTTAFQGWTIFQLRLKIALFFDSLFFDFGSILGPKMAPKSQKILKKSTSKSHLNSNVFSILFFMFFLGFPTPANVKNITKLMECCSFLHFSSFLLRLAIGTHFRPYWTRFGSGFGSIFEYFWNKKATENLMISDFVFSRFWVDFGLQVGPQLWHHSGGIGLQSALRSPWRPCFDFLSPLASFWDDLGAILERFGTSLGTFFVKYSVRFSSHLGFFSKFSFSSSLHPFIHFSLRCD